MYTRWYLNMSIDNRRVVFALSFCAQWIFGAAQGGGRCNLHALRIHMSCRMIPCKVCTERSLWVAVVVEEEDYEGKAVNEVDAEQNQKHIDLEDKSAHRQSAHKI